VEKRSITISGHRTSVALEPDFWAALGEIAADRTISLTTLIIEIDRLRGSDNLASACRLAVLRHFRKSSLMI
jgi:predicted DNA-binding ribbon-helix-helix protein